ncbi:MAG: hypothetical protein QM528_06085 [Phycisphaerales bacterium]|nr:hypothetical protein [Phycisphaerales bacterium]
MRKENLRYFKCINISFFFILYAITNSYSQNFGGNPFSTRWDQVNNKSVKVIFPRGYGLEYSAERIAHIANDLALHHATSIGPKYRKISVVLQADQLVTNGFVQLAPWKSEFFLTPLQNPFQLGAIRWSDYLSIHEYRHVQQYSNFNRGLSKVGSILFGEAGQSLLNAMSIPDWFFEGDAVFNETMFSNQGRGRLPLFMNSFKALYLADKHYSFETIRNGSLRKYVPNWYNFGYLIVSYVKIKYGKTIWYPITADASAFKNLFYPLQRSIKKRTGKSYKTIVKEAFAYYENQWKLEKQKNVDWITPTVKHDVVNYLYPYTIDSSILILRNSLRNIPTFYKITGNKIKKIIVRDITVDDYYSYKNNRIIYTSYDPSDRWSNQNYNSIRIYNLKTHRYKTIVKYSRYFSPDINQQGTRIVAVDIKANFTSSMCLLNDQGQILKQVNGGDSLVFSYPKFAYNDTDIYVVARNSRGNMSIGRYTHDSLNWLFPFSNRTIGFLNVQHDTLLFVVTNDGSDELWAYIDKDSLSHKLFRLAQYSTGIYQSALNNHGQIVASCFTSEGYRLAQLNPAWEPLNFGKELYPLYIDSGLATKYFNKNYLNTVSDTPYYPIKKYPLFSHPFNINTWRHFYLYPIYNLTILGNNVLNTTQTLITFQFNQNERSHLFGGQFVYGGFYIQPTVSGNYTLHRSILNVAKQTFIWNEWNFSVGGILPLNFTKRRNYQTLSVSLYNTTVGFSGKDDKYLFPINLINYVQLGVTYYRSTQQATQQIFPDFAQNLSFTANQALTAPVHQYLLSTSFYFPGIFRNNSLELDIAYQLRDNKKLYYYTNAFPFSRGYIAINFQHIYKAGLNYHFPIVYPDWGFANILYFFRIRANVFGDCTIGGYNQNQYLFPSTGIEVYFDTRVWNEYNFTFGIRYSRTLLGVGGNRVEYIIPFNLFSKP